MENTSISPVHSFGEQFLVVLLIPGPMNTIFSLKVYFCIYLFVRGAANLQFGQEVDRGIIQLLSSFRSRNVSGRLDTRKNSAGGSTARQLSTRRAKCDSTF